jgi:ABC-2 type transport system ATP-binding protein
MTDYVVKTMNLSKKYKNNLVVDNLNLNIKRGEIYGFIGENGAGKSTTLRMLTGLSKPTSGKINLFGFDFESKSGNFRKRIGALIESPAFYPSMSAYENLEACRIQKGIPGKKSTDKLLEFVDLPNPSKKKVKNFSMGMKQKLGLAIALMGDPELLILDEPVNGLDPVGIVQMREKLKKLNSNKNMTIIISSHILGELYQLASCFEIIHRGKLIEELTLETLNKKCRRSLNIKTDNVEKAAVILEGKLNTSNFNVLPDKTIALYDYIDNPGKVSSALSRANVTIEQIMPTGQNLEDYFINLIGGLK